ncbi:MAG TPA: hypothetical protein VFM21_03965 [Terriglobia bacterium]|nr:hypothetical protein [Terriglobia bacterium]
MRKKALAVAVLIASTAICFASPQQSTTTPSLGELARKLKAEKDKSTTKPAKVFTNDNIPKTGDLMVSSSESGSAETSKPGGEKVSAASETSGGEKSGAHDEKYYREKTKELQSQKEMHQRELAILEQKLNENQVQYYSDPNKTLNQESNPGQYRSDINKKQEEIEKKKQQIAGDDKAIQDLQDQCNREGCPPGWLR